MAAGDVQYVGWTTSPSTYEYAARVNYVPVYNNYAGDTVLKRLVRTIRCHDTVKTSVIQQLKNNTALTLPAVQADGSLGTVAFGGGYELKSISDAKAAIGFSLLTVIYEKQVSTLFEFNLPTGVTITNSGGVSAILYNDNELVSFDSGKGATTSGLEIIQAMDPNRAIRHLFEYQDAAHPDRIPSVPFQFVVDGVIFQTVNVRAADMTGSVTTILSESYAIDRETWRSNTLEPSQALGEDFAPAEPPANPPDPDPYQPTPIDRFPGAEESTEAGGDAAISDKEASELSEMNGADEYSIESESYTETGELTNTDTGQSYTYPIAVVRQRLKLTKTKTVPGSRYGIANPGGNNYYTGRTLRPEWELANDQLRIHVAGATLMKWDVGGL